VRRTFNGHAIGGPDQSLKNGWLGAGLTKTVIMELVTAVQISEITAGAESVSAGPTKG